MPLQLLSDTMVSWIELFQLQYLYFPHCHSANYNVHI